jgi:hypothetical protein
MGSGLVLSPAISASGVDVGAIDGYTRPLMLKGQKDPRPFLGRTMCQVAHPGVHFDWVLCKIAWLFPFFHWWEKWNVYYGYLEPQ